MYAGVRMMEEQILMASDRPETEMRHMAAFREHYPTHCELGEQLLRLVDEGIASVAKQRQSGSRPLQPQPFALHLLFTKGYKALWSVIIPLGTRSSAPGWDAGGVPGCARRTPS
jgi:hypothetical protein